MAANHRDIRLERRPGRKDGGPFQDEPPLGELFRQLSADATRLVRQEVALGKAELRETGSAIARDAAKIGVAAGLGLLGAQAVTAFLIIALGALLGSYWAAALIVAVVYSTIAAVLVQRAREDLRSRSLKPEQTIETLRDDVVWAREEAAAVKREWKS
jgi:hypothetical protein